MNFYFLGWYSVFVYKETWWIGSWIYVIIILFVQFFSCFLLNNNWCLYPSPWPHRNLFNYSIVVQMPKRSQLPWFLIADCLFSEPLKSSVGFLRVHILKAVSIFPMTGTHASYRTLHGPREGSQGSLRSFLWCANRDMIFTYGLCSCIWRILILSLFKGFSNFGLAFYFWCWKQKQSVKFQLLYNK